MKEISPTNRLHWMTPPKTEMSY